MSCCDIRSSKGLLGTILRISFGLALLFHGITLYMGFEGFMGMTKDGLGPLEPLGTLWAYVLPGLMIVGGALLTLRMYTYYATWAAGLALGSIPIGMMLKPILSDTSSADMMGATINAFIWLLVFMFVVKYASCCDPNSGCGCGPNGHSHQHPHQH